jgi:hypothetical protein
MQVMLPAACCSPAGVVVLMLFFLFGALQCAGSFERMWLAIQLLFLLSS